MEHCPADGASRWFANALKAGCFLRGLGRGRANGEEGVSKFLRIPARVMRADEVLLNVLLISILSNKESHLLHARRDISFIFGTV